MGRGRLTSLLLAGACILILFWALQIIQSVLPDHGTIVFDPVYARLGKVRL